MNVDTSKESIDSSIQSIIDYSLIIIYVAFALSGLVGNILVLLALSFKKGLKKVADIFILNLTVADLFLCLIYSMFEVCIYFFESRLVTLYFLCSKDPILK